MKRGSVVREFKVDRSWLGEPSIECSFEQQQRRRSIGNATSNDAQQPSTPQLSHLGAFGRYDRLCSMRSMLLPLPPARIKGLSLVMRKDRPQFLTAEQMTPGNST